jgi:hypothetical protein
VQLVEVHRSDQNCAQGDVLPERREAEHDEAVEQCDRDDDADQRARQSAGAAKQTGARDDDAGDHLQIVGCVGAEVRGSNPLSSTKKSSQINLIS